MMVLGVFLVLLVLICINVPIAVALAVAAVVGLLVTEGQALWSPLRWTCTTIQPNFR
jgi:hypothetical protein